MKLKKFFKEKYLGYELFYYPLDEDVDRTVIDIDVCISKRGFKMYRGFITDEERKSLDLIYDEYSNKNVEYLSTKDTLDIDHEHKKIYVYEEAN